MKTIKCRCSCQHVTSYILLFWTLSLQTQLVFVGFPGHLFNYLYVMENEVKYSTIYNPLAVTRAIVSWLGSYI